MRNLISITGASKTLYAVRLRVVTIRAQAGKGWCEAGRGVWPNHGMSRIANAAGNLQRGLRRGDDGTVRSELIGGLY